MKLDSENFKSWATRAKVFLGDSEYFHQTWSNKETKTVIEAAPQPRGVSAVAENRKRVLVY